MKIYRKVGFSILFLFLFSFSPNVARAGGVLDALTSLVSSVVSIAVDITNFTVNAPLAIAEITIGYSLGLGFLPGFDFLVDDGNCRLQNMENNSLAIYAGECDSGFRFALAVPSTVAGEGCNFQIPLTFYNPRMNVSYYQIYGLS
jgi:hypothetical protein